MNNCAIVCLTRGYHNKEGYQTLIDRNCAIRKHINADKQYPMIIFHEGNITADHQEHINYYSEGQTIQFIDISYIWRGGYEAMCEFHIYHIWHLCYQYNYIMRIDEDCIVTRCESDPFKQIDKVVKVRIPSSDEVTTSVDDRFIEVGDTYSYEKLVFLRPVNWAESHSETNASLPPMIEGLTGEDPATFYIHNFPYTNLCIGKVDFFLSPPMVGLLYTLSQSPLQRENRWGDLPVLGSLLNIYAKDRTAFIKGLSYLHGSHEVLIDTDKSE